MLTDRLILYRINEESFLYRFAGTLLPVKGSTRAFSEDEAYSLVHALVEHGVSCGYYGNLWHCLLADHLVTNENAYTLRCEITGDPGGDLSALAEHDLAVFMELFAADISSIERRCGLTDGLLTDFHGSDDSGHRYSRRIRNEIVALGRALAEAGNVRDFQTLLHNFYRRYGVGTIGLHKAFRIDEEGGIFPVSRIAHVALSDLVGYETQKQALIENTESFVCGRRANNCLLYGEAGTGKSTSIKAIINQYYDRGLRMIEIYKHQFHHLNRVISQIKNRHYRFILYLDDLSFEEFETEYKYLKALIEGGLEERPENVLIYATSNRRHLVRESFGDKSDMDDLHHSETTQEKLSLYGRFGVTIYYGSPDKKQYNEIVKVLKERNGLSLSEDELLAQANMWELSHGGLSGRTAQQFIDHLLGKS